MFTWLNLFSSSSILIQNPTVLVRTKTVMTMVVKEIFLLVVVAQSISVSMSVSILKTDLILICRNIFISSRTPKNNKKMKTMKIKQFFRVLFLGATAFTLGSCSDDIAQLENVDNPLSQQDFTLFSSGTPERTRTTAQMDKTGETYTYPFYWTHGDHIWVKGDNGLWRHSHENSNFSDHVSEVGSAGGWKKAHFLVNGNFTKDTYPVIYVGPNSPSIDKNQDPNSMTATGPLKVVVKKEQMQEAEFNADHFATSGDCGIATAEKRSNGYEFQLKHLAAYLLIYPWHNIKYSNGSPAHLTLDKIIIEEVSENGKDGADQFAPYPIAGTHQISANATELPAPLKDENDPNGTRSTTIEFQCGPHEQGFTIPYNKLSYETVGSFVVMSPSRATDSYSKRKLKMTFHYFDMFHRKFEFPYTMATPKEFLGNSFTRFYPKISASPIPETPEYGEGMYYGWDGQYAYNGAVGGAPYNTASWNDNELVVAQWSCKNMPDINELYWYWRNGDVRWDNVTSYTVKVKYIDMGEDKEYNVTQTGGVWIKKRDAILRDGSPTYSSGNAIFQSELVCKHPSHDADGFYPAFCDKHGYESETNSFTDMRYWFPDKVDEHTKFSTPPSYPLGKPSEDKLDDYFFLPALGQRHGKYPSNVGTHGYYWSSSICKPHSQTTSDNSWYLEFTSRHFYVTSQNGVRSNGFVAGDGWFH